MKAIFFLIVGLALVAAAAVVAGGVQRFRQSALRADGRVVALNAGGSHPEVAFTTRAGAQVTYPQGGLIFGYRPGDRVRVLYSAAAPRTSASIDSLGALWFWPILLGFIGGGFALGGLLEWFARKGA